MYGYSDDDPRIANLRNFDTRDERGKPDEPLESMSIQYAPLVTLAFDTRKPKQHIFQYGGLHINNGVSMLFRVCDAIAAARTAC